MADKEFQNKPANITVVVADFFRAWLSSIAFLSRIPLYKLVELPQTPDFSKISHTFPLAGIVIALPTALLVMLLHWIGLPPVVVAILAVLTLVLTTGALHEDGLADVADGFWGGSSRARKLEIMRDSTIGTYGAIALILSLTLRTTLLAVLFETQTVLQMAVLIIAMGSLSRTALLVPWSMLPAARAHSGGTGEQNGKDPAGLSARYGTPALGTLTYASLLSTPAIVILIFAIGLPAMVASIAVMMLLVFTTSIVAKQHIGGHTGDVLGATQQISEIGLLLGLVAFM